MVKISLRHPRTASCLQARSDCVVGSAGCGRPAWTRCRRAEGPRKRPGGFRRQPVAGPCASGRAGPDNLFPAETGFGLVFDAHSRPGVHGEEWRTPRVPTSRWELRGLRGLGAGRVGGGGTRGHYGLEHPRLGARLSVRGLAGEGRTQEARPTQETAAMCRCVRPRAPPTANERALRDGCGVGCARERRQQTSNQTQTDSLSPSPNPVSPVPLNNPTSAPRYGTVIPNRIFVGGIDFKTNENDLRKFFSQYGSVKEVKIVNDRAGVSKGYGFITFETQEDAQKILQEAEKLNYKDKKLNIGPAIRKQQVGIPRSSIMPAAGTMYLTTSTGYPYTYHNGVAYFHTPEVASVPPPWPSRSISSSPVMVAQPVYQQPAYHYQAPAQCLPGQWQWGVPQSPASSAPFLYLQPPEVIYQPVEIAQDGGCVPPPLSLMEASVPEPYSDHGVQAAYHQVYAPSAIALSAPVMQPEPIKMFFGVLLVSSFTLFLKFG
ncbi:protein boule-like isoform X2 [Tamandua tetradactyla]|uniref:protein boule-like isoform X2 n=1 Tax=Tamandua tetradactyla TaxID=48850 RepID=UPI00405406A6